MILVNEKFFIIYIPALKMPFSKMYIFQDKGLIPKRPFALLNDSVPFSAIVWLCLVLPTKRGDTRGRCIHLWVFWLATARNLREAGPKLGVKIKLPMSLYCTYIVVILSLFVL